MAYTEYYSEICDILLFSHFTIKYVHFMDSLSCGTKKKESGDLRSFLTPMIYGGELLASRCDRFNFEKRATDDL